MRTHEEVYTMIQQAKGLQDKWRREFEECKERHHREGMVVAVRNHKALEGVIKTLRWVMEQPNVDTPLY